jgi:hypothetical protein
MSQSRDGSFVPQPAVSNRSKTASQFDHLVGAGAINAR